MFQKRLIARLVLILMLIGLPVLAQDMEPCPPASETAKSDRVESVEPAELGSTVNVHRSGDVYLSGQFQPEDIDALQAAGIKRVISLRTPGEIDWDEQAVLEAAGIEFIEVPFRKPESLDDDVFAEIRGLLSDPSGRTLLHCGSANRVGGIWLPFRVLDQGVDLETALEEARSVGLKAEFIERMAIDYIRRQATSKKPEAANRPSDRAPETSVKPGINDSFLDPDLDVDEFVARFEIESREVYLERREIVAACQIEPGDRVADVGAGTGLFTRLFAQAVGNKGWVFAVDIAPRFIEHINAQADELQIENITGVVCAQDRINLPPAAVDLVFICDTYHHFEFPKSTLASIELALKPGGRLVVVDFERIEGQSRDWVLGHVRAGKQTVRGEIQDAGFDFAGEIPIDGLEENYFLIFRKQ